MQCPITLSTEKAFLADDGPYKWYEVGPHGIAIADISSRELDEPEYQESMSANYIDDYLTKWNSKFWRSLKRAFVLRLLAKNSRLLDIGSNVGLFCRSAKLLGFRPTGIEISRSLIEFSRTKFPTIEFINCGFENFETTEKFGAIYCSEVLEHTTDPRAFTQKIYDLLVPGGALYLTTPSLLQYRTNDFFTPLGAPDHKIYFDHENIKLFLQSIGFRKITVHRSVKIRPFKKPFISHKGIKCFAFK